MTLGVGFYCSLGTRVKKSENGENYINVLLTREDTFRVNCFSVYNVKL